MSDPTAIQLPVHQALTSDMLLGLKPSAPRSRTYRINQAPVNQSIFQPGQVVIIELPTGRRGTWLDQSQSYLKFSVQVGTTAACAVGGTGVYIDNSAYSFINRLDIYNSSNLLETQLNYGEMANLFLDLSLTQSDKAGLSSMIGTNPTATYMNTQNAYVQYNSVTCTQTPGDRSGMSLAGTTNIATSIPYTFTLPLVSGIVGVNSSKMLPVGRLHAPIRMEIYLASNDDAVYYGLGGAGCTWQLVNVEFCACYVELQDDIEQHMPPGVPEYISTVTHRSSSVIIPAATSGEFTTLLPFRCASLKSIYARFRNQASAVQGANATAAYRLGSSVNPNFSNYYFRVGSSMCPNKPVYLNNGYIVGSGSEGYAEVLKSFHALSSSIGNTALTANMYNVLLSSAGAAVNGWAVPYGPSAKTAGALDTSNNGFCLALELESFCNRSDSILSGISTLNTQIYFTGNGISGATTGASNITMDVFVSMDMILIIQDGIMSAKF